MDDIKFLSLLNRTGKLRKLLILIINFSPLLQGESNE